MCLKNGCRLEIVFRFKDGRTRTGILQEIICDCVKLTDSSHFYEYEIEDVAPAHVKRVPVCLKQSPQHQIMKTSRKRRT